MIIIGEKLIEYQPLYFIRSEEDIAKTPPNSTVIFEFKTKTVELCRHCQKERVAFALIVDSFKELILASSFDPAYLVCDKSLVQKGQKFADDYVIDPKILCYTSQESDLEWVAEHAIDGILFEGGIDYGSC